jgi:hypothetical protein
MSSSEADASKAYASACDAIQNRVKHRIGRNCVVVFHAYKLNADRLPIDNLDEVPVSGKLLIRSGRRRRAAQSIEFESPVVENPSWLELCVIANNQLIATRDRKHRYLEQIDVVGSIDEIQVAVLRLLA